MKTKVKYYEDHEGYFVAVTDETPRGPLKGFVFVGRRLVGDNVREEALGIDQIAKWKKLEPGEVDPRCLVALGYEAPPEPVFDPTPCPRTPELPQAEGDGVNSGEGLIIHGPKPQPSARYLGFALAVILYVAAVAFFWITKNA